jgi:hypothetical protein
VYSAKNLNTLDKQPILGKPAGQVATTVAPNGAVTELRLCRMNTHGKSTFLFVFYPF